MIKEFQRLVWKSFSDFHLLGIREEKAANFLLFNYLWLFLADKYGLHRPSMSEENLKEFEVELNRHLQETDLWFDSVRDLFDQSKDKIAHIQNDWNGYFLNKPNDEIWSPGMISQAIQIFENSMAKSSDAHQYFTPPEVVQLVSGIIDAKNAKSVYDPFCRSGHLLNSAIQNSEMRATGKSANSFSLRLARARFFLLGNHNAALELKIPIEIRECQSPSQLFDIIVTNPPFGKLPVQSQGGLGYFSSKYKVNDLALSFFTHSLDSLSENGQLAIILPTGILSNSGVYVDFKQELIEKNILEAVIQLPQKIFYATAVSASVWVVNKHKTSKNLLVMDVSEEGQKSRERYELRKDAITGVLTRIEQFRNGKLTDENADNFLIASPQELHEANYNLSFGYLKNGRSKLEINHRPSYQIMEECMELEKRLSNIQKQIIHLVKN